jgi:hypothetical protein
MPSHFPCYTYIHHLFVYPAASFNVPAGQLPHPESDWQSFCNAVSALNDKTPVTWSGATKSMQKWVVMNKLQAAYGRGAGKGASGSSEGGGCCTTM